MTILNFKTTDDLVTGLEFNLASRDERWERFKSHEHEALAEELAFGDVPVFESVIVTCEHLAEEHFDDPAYNLVDHSIIVSEVEEEGRTRHMNRYMPIGDTHKILTANEASFVASNHSTEQENRKHICDLEDGVFAAETLSHYPDIIAECKEAFRYHDNGRKKAQKKFDETWPKELVRILSPRTMMRIERVTTAMPEPFAWWDSRNCWQQWFFWKTGDSYNYVQGGSGSSQQREYQGLFAHTFAYARQKYDINIPTTWLHFDQHNRLFLKEVWPDFRTMLYELSGNYQVDRKDTMPLFDDILKSFNWETRKLEDWSGY